MEAWANSWKLSVEPIPAPTRGWGEPEAPKSPWAKETPVQPSYQTDEGLKKQYGIELAKAKNAFDAACKIFEDTSRALWAATNWVADPIVIASRDVYLKTVELSSPALDKTQLAAKVLALADEKILTSSGVLAPTIDAKDRIAALKLYSEILGYTGKVDIDASTKTFTHNEMVVKFVKPEPKVTAAPTIDNAPNVKSENVVQGLPINLKLVGGSK